MRKQKAQQSLSADDVDSGVANKLMADKYFDGDETEAQLQEALSKLPDVQRTVFNLRYFEDMKYSEISKILHTSEGALKASYHIAVKKITDFFNKLD
jgi:RNA polymerase sigma-70 factor (ECF subfamily)